MCSLQQTENLLEMQIKLIRKYLKLRIMADTTSFRGHSQEKNNVYDLFKRTVAHGESHSALMIGPRGSGKTTLINSVLHQISKEVDLSNDAIIVRLNGLIHHDDKIALKSITAQMQLENAVGDRVFGTFAENLAFLLSCLHSGADRRCKSMLFILEEFDMFCHSGRTQTLLYNLFDITHSEQAPMCVLGVTNRIDVMELLEKRVKSRFSHRHLFIFPNEDDSQRAPQYKYQDVLVQLLSLPEKETTVATPKKKGRSRRNTVTTEDMETDTTAPTPSLYPHLQSRVNLEALEPDFIQDWNEHVASLAQEHKVIDCLEKLCYYTVNEQIFRNVLAKKTEMQHGQEKSPNKNIDSDLTKKNENTFDPMTVFTVHSESNTNNMDNESIFELTIEYQDQSDTTTNNLVLKMSSSAINFLEAGNAKVVLQFELVSKLSVDNPFIDEYDLSSIIDNTVAPEHRVKLLQSLSILELSLVIAMKHGMEIFDGQPMNFEMVLHRYTKFANSNSSTQTVPRPVILKAFEHLQELEIIMPVRTTDSIYNSSDTTASRVQKEYKLYTLAVPNEDISDAVKSFKALPTEINHWFNNSVV